jgi:hypothetical protein
MFRCYMNASARVGAYRSRPAEELQKSKGGWMQFSFSSLSYFISLFAKRPLYRQPAALAHAYQLFREAAAEAKHRIGRHASGRRLEEPTFSPASAADTNLAYL